MLPVHLLLLFFVWVTLSFFSFSLFHGLAAVCDCGTPRTFLLTSFIYLNLLSGNQCSEYIHSPVTDNCPESAVGKGMAVEII